MIRPVDHARLGTVCRAIRIKKQWRQSDLAARARVTRTVISDIETGRVARTRVDDVVRVMTALGGSIDFVVRWQGGELDRLINARHAAMHETVARQFRSRAGWEIAPEVSFNVRGERGVIDILAWHAATRTLLVIELKTEIVDISDLMGTLDRKRRVAPPIAAERGWNPARVAVWLVVADSAMNRRRVWLHATTLRAALPDDGRALGGWLRRPTTDLRCLSYLTNAAHSDAKRGLATVKRVRRPVSKRA
jgi:transcriptional regulator with XRE-family HTH domain